MHKIIITSDKFKGSLEFEMEDNQIVRSFSNEAVLNQKQIEKLSGNFPLTLDQLNKLIKESPSLKAELIEVEITFEMFWDKYGMKRNKNRAERFWNKLSRADRQLAWNNLNPYFAYLDRNPQQQKQYPDTYLNPVERRFENEYK